MPRLPFFHLHSKNILLTYPQCSIPVLILLESLKELFPVNPPYYIRVSSETHEDGNTHCHCLLQFERKFLTLNRNFFDISHGGRSFHPNSKGARTAAAVNDFISKYNEFVDSGTYREVKTSSGSGHGPYPKILSAAKDKDQYLSMIREQHPRSYVLNYARLKNAAERLFPSPEPAYVPLFTYFPNCPPSLLEWAYSNLGIGPHSGPLANPPKSLILEGHTRTGKTQWARSLGPHNYYAGCFDLSRHRNDVMYNVIDDIEPKYLRHLERFIGSRRDWTANVQYGKARKIKGGVPCIMLCCGIPSYFTYFSKKSPALFEWIQCNASFVNIYDNKLF